MQAPTRIALTLTWLLAIPIAWAERPADPIDGQVHRLADDSFEAWDAVNGRWVDPLQFWLGFAERSGGLTWGRSSEYPPYDAVSEHDTILIELDSGPCLMEFFHRRWRRARDVWRWGEEFNDFGGCPNVFE